MTKTYTHKAYDTIVEDDISATLKASGENYGGGSETFILCDWCSAQSDEVDNDGKCNKHE